MFFVFVGLPKKNKSNTRAEIEGNVCLRETEHMPAVRIRFLPPVRPVRELILYISGSVRFGFPTAGFWAVSGSRGSVPGSRFGSRTFINMPLIWIIMEVTYKLKWKYHG